MIKNMEKKEETPDSRMFMKASGCCRLKENGYIEEEYFFDGTANIYGEDGTGKAKILYHDAPYTNRFVVRRPLENPSGRVVIEILNSSSYMDIDRFWVLTYRQMIRNRDTYIGITSKPVTAKTMKKFDPERYSALNWRNPRSSLFPKMDLGNFKGASEPETEDGLFWDMFTDLALRVREGADFLNGWKPEHVYAAGWSQSGAYLVTYSNYFARARYEEGKQPVFDGYYSAAPGPCVVPGLNQSEMADIHEGEATLHFSSVPYFILHTESENAGLGTCLTRIPNSDEVTLQHRIYEIPGATHDSAETMFYYYDQAENDSERVGLYLVYPGVEENPNDFPYYFAYDAGLECLYQWVEKGRKPPVLDSIPYNEKLKNVTDESGNAVGGWRLPEIDAPVCVYRPRCTPLKPGADVRLFGCEIPYSKEKLKNMYGSLEQYRKKIKILAENAVKNRLLLEADVDECIEHAAAKAQKYGLE